MFSIVLFRSIVKLQSADDAFFFFQAEDGIRDYKVTGVQTCALPIFGGCRSGRCVGDLRSPTASGLQRSGSVSARQPADQENHRRSDYEKPSDSIDNLKSLAVLV